MTRPCRDAAIDLMRAALPEGSWNRPAFWPAWAELLRHVLALADQVGLVEIGKRGPLLEVDAVGYQLMVSEKPEKDVLTGLIGFFHAVEHFGEDDPRTLTAARTFEEAVDVLDRAAVTRFAREHPESPRGRGLRLT